MVTGMHLSEKVNESEKNLAPRLQKHPKFFVYLKELLSVEASQSSEFTRISSGVVCLRATILFAASVSVISSNYS